MGRIRKSLKNGMAECFSAPSRTRDTVFVLERKGCRLEGVTKKLQDTTIDGHQFGVQLVFEFRTETRAGVRCTPPANVVESLEIGWRRRGFDSPRRALLLPRTLFEINVQRKIRLVFLVVAVKEQSETKDVGERTVNGGGKRRQTSLLLPLPPCTFCDLRAVLLPRDGIHSTSQLSSSLSSESPPYAGPDSKSGRPGLRNVRMEKTSILRVGGLAAPAWKRHSYLCPTFLIAMLVDWTRQNTPHQENDIHCDSDHYIHNTAACAAIATRAEDHLALLLDSAVSPGTPLGDTGRTTSHTDAARALRQENLRPLCTHRPRITPTGHDARRHPPHPVPHEFSPSRAPSNRQRLGFNFRFEDGVADRRAALAQRAAFVWRPQDTRVERRIDGGGAVSSFVCACVCGRLSLALKDAGSRSAAVALRVDDEVRTDAAGWGSEGRGRRKCRRGGGGRAGGVTARMRLCLWRMRMRATGRGRCVGRVVVRVRMRAHRGARCMCRRDDPVERTWGWRTTRAYACACGDDREERKRGWRHGLGRRSSRRRGSGCCLPVYAYADDGRMGEGAEGEVFLPQDVLVVEHGAVLVRVRLRRGGWGREAGSWKLAVGSWNWNMAVSRVCLCEHHQGGEAGKLKCAGDVVLEEEQRPPFRWNGTILSAARLGDENPARSLDFRLTSTFFIPQLSCILPVY
ncbi:hypothetical protein C8R46DRAFT_1192890 [Mycena filopes]|nr:hypothetical protein C8R46DRAFT_1192890 [Mycena filopes]